jgi:hypothetical protein
MKKRKLKKWCENILIVIMFILILILMSDSNNIILFISTKIIAIISIYIIGKILSNHTNIIE